MFTAAYRRAKDLVQSNIGVLHKCAEVLMEREQIDGDEFLRIVQAEQAKQYLKEDADVTIPYRGEPQLAAWIETSLAVLTRR